MTAAFLIFDSSRFKYDVIDYYVDSSGYGKMTFMFIKVNKYDRKNMSDLAKEINLNHESMKLNDTGRLKILVAHFYRSGDIAPLPMAMRTQLLKKYPEIRDVDRKLDYIPKGYVYSAFSRKVPGFKMPQDSLFSIPFVIPRQGVKIQDIMKHNSMKPQTGDIND